MPSLPRLPSTVVRRTMALGEFRSAMPSRFGVWTTQSSIVVAADDSTRIP
jgi:hypothetical protein